MGDTPRICTRELAKEGDSLVALLPPERLLACYLLLVRSLLGEVSVAVVLVACPVTPGAVAVFHRAMATCCPPPGGLAAVMSCAMVEGVVVVIVPVSARAVVAAGVVVVVLPAASLSQRVRDIVVPQELPAWLPIGRPPPPPPRP